MSYTVTNYKTKKELLADVKAGQPVRCYQPGLGPSLSTFTGTVYLEGPHFPLPHRWYATGQMKDGILVSVR